MPRGLYLVYLVSVFHSVAGQSVQYGLLGQSVSLNPNIKTSAGGMLILWTHDGEKVVEFIGNKQQVYSPYEDRVTLDWHSAQLNITDLRYEDSGQYELEVFSNNILDRFRLSLKVIDKVPKPSIRCVINEDSHSGKKALLMCSAELGQSKSLTRFEWRSGEIMWSGPDLIIPVGKEQDDPEYSCTVSNPLSQETAAFTLKECDSGGSSAATISIICVIILCLLLVAVLVDCKLKRKACFGNKVDEEFGGKALELTERLAGINDSETPEKPDRVMKEQDVTSPTESTRLNEPEDGDSDGADEELQQKIAGLNDSETPEKADSIIKQRDRAREEKIREERFRLQSLANDEAEQQKKTTPAAALLPDPQTRQPLTTFMALVSRTT